MKDWNEGEWLQWLHSANNGVKSQTNADRLNYEMDKWPYPRLQSLISKVNTCESNGWRYSCPMWLDDSHVFSVYGRLFAVIRFEMGPHPWSGHVVTIKVDDIDDGDNIYRKTFATEEEAEAEIKSLYKDFCEDQEVFSGVFFNELIVENGYQRA